MAVNLSAVQCKNEEILDTMRHVLATSGRPAARLDLEITQTMVAKHTGTASALLRELHKLGVNILVDDFGTGYASLSYLRSFPISRIKIDQTFVRDLARRDNVRLTQYRRPTLMTR